MEFDFDEIWNDTGAGTTNSGGVDSLGCFEENDDSGNVIIGNNNDSQHLTSTTSMALEPYSLPLDPDIDDFPEPLIQNVIASVNLCTELDLRLIAISSRNAEYNPTKVNAVVIRLRRPKCTGLLFRSGRMMVTGARSEEDAHVGGKKIAKLCSKIGHPELRFRGFKIENMIASADCGFPVRLEGLAHDHSSYSSYEPEMFSGLVYRYNLSNTNKAVLLVFVSGKVIITGCRTVDQIQQVFKAIFPVLSQYRK